jgi:drug/metabolite transporter (DMT)-like permease
MISPRLGVAVMVGLATIFGANHVAARLAFEHGTSVSAAVVVRSGCTALVVLALLRVQRASLAVPRPTLVRALAIGALVAVQSFCLYSAVALIPVALALLAFNTFPLLFVLLSWVADGQRPPRHIVLVIPLAFAGLALALDVVGKLDAVAGQWAKIGAGVGFALTASGVMAVILLLTNRWLKEVGARVRTFLTMTTTAVLVLAVGALARSLALPVDATGWIGLAVLTTLYGIGFTVMFTIVTHLASPTATVALNFEPIAAMILAWLVLGQAVTPTQILGGLLVIGALVLLVLKR